MTRNLAVIRCMTKSKCGFGHLRRSLLLAKELRKKKYYVFFIIDSNSNAKKLLVENKFSFFELKKNLSLKQEYVSISNILSKSTFSFIILDARERNEQLSKFLIEKSIFTIVIDDAWCKYAYAHIMFNPTIVKQFHNYELTKNNMKIYVGPEYFITDKNFVKSQKNQSSIIQKKNYIITISMGGSDVENLAYKFTKSLISMPNVFIQIILGPFTFLDVKFEKLIADQNNISIIKSPQKIWNIFKKSDIVISNAGSTLYELFIQKVPAIYCAVETHQIPYAENFKKLRFGYYLGFKNEIDYKKVPSLLNDILLEPSTRKKMIQIKNVYFNGLGAQKISDLILNQRKIYLKRIS